ncbi:glutamate-1-semialdehyde 2,1-aminomutase, putative chloroplast precursor [Ectocarpus siliculosus]|uniref:glutamate-1-semialdehyde 2,1-aminomutase n=1 Tax=Ectocarpus siliculosus TaxID=2880 RepID=D7G5Q0_ECTSI|nr:glutamate-1-semialdehyde 2,1-aminomutase, putative chloroplast precursor [Ectocarpus siliculosus]|eukprot:CBJ27347.1 glutamate-1-semialdehyde 2,1-aminomutase, putative chloroplast precursor [Ectocarpus siliculosus]
MDFNGGRAISLAVTTAACLLSAEPGSAFIAPAVVTSTRASTAASSTPTMVSASPSKTFVTTKSEETFEEAKGIMPGGVSSPVRAFKSVGGNPIVFERVKGAYAWDVDGNKYTDYVGTWGPAIVGHADDEVLDAIKETLEKGTSFGAPSLHENTLAKMVIDAVPSVDMVRFTNSGTEACMGMLRLVRAYTKREKIVKFDGCYHGHADGFLVQAGSGVATLGLPDSPGVPQGSTQNTLVATYNDLENVEELIKGGDVAAVILEPVVGNSGFIKPTPEFLKGCRELCTKYGTLLVFDEVMTGFRIAYGGAQDYFGVTPDVTTMGKVIGGGLPVGAYGGRKDIMEMVAPAGPMYQAGTLSGNPLAMTAGIKTLEILQRPGSYDKLEALSKRMVEGILAAAKEHGHEATGGYIRGMFGFYFNKGPVNNFVDASKSDSDKFARWHRGMLEKGMYLAPSMYEAGFMSLAHTEEDVDATIAAAREVMATL